MKTKKGISYERMDNASGDEAVFLDGKRVGTILGVMNGWRYFPLGSQDGGDTFATKGEVKKSLQE